MGRQARRKNPVFRTVSDSCTTRRQRRAGRAKLAGLPVCPRIACALFKAVNPPLFRTEGLPSFTPSPCLSAEQTVDSTLVQPNQLNDLATYFPRETPPALNRGENPVPSRSRGSSFTLKWSRPWRPAAVPALFNRRFPCGREDREIVYQLLNFTLAPTGRDRRCPLRGCLRRGGNRAQLMRTATRRRLVTRKRINRPNSFHTTSPRRLSVNSN